MTAPWGISGGWNVVARPSSAIVELGTSSHIIIKDFWTFPVVFHPSKVPQAAVMHDGSLRYLGRMECNNKTLFCHSRTGHFFSYSPERFLDFSCCIPSLLGASSSHLVQWLLQAPRGDGYEKCITKIIILNICLMMFSKLHVFYLDCNVNIHIYFNWNDSKCIHNMW